MIRIGVSGHRILTGKRRINTGIEEVLSRIKASYPAQEWMILSSLAEGADCLFVEKALKYMKAKLIVPLPLPIVEYLQVFSTDTAKKLFSQLYQQAEEVIQIESNLTKEHAYLAAGKYILDHCDVLAAIWDGKDAHGQGGTGEIVKMARARDLPVAWIQADNRHPGTRFPTTLGDKQGTVIYERFPGQK